MSDVTRILGEMRQGDGKAAERLIAAVYDELRGLAAAKLKHERPGQTLQATALVNEAWIRLSGAEGNWENRAHFFGAAAEAMRRILVDNARARARLKRGGDRRRLPLTAVDPPAPEPDLDLLALDEALDKLAEEDEQLVELVKLRYFTGLGVREVAEVLGVSKATAERRWAFAKAWLLDAMTDE
jgi:RNA polymerase sigma factor (TIGR02999 family)